MLAWDLLRFVPDRLYKIAGRVTFPAFCLLQDNNPELAWAYRNFFANIAKVVLPVAACATVAAPELIGTIYGSRWLPAAQILRMLSMGLALLGLRTGIGSIYYAKARPALDIYLHGARLLLIAGAVCGLSHIGLTAIGAAMSAVEGSVSVVGLLLASTLVEIGLRDLMAAALPGLRLGFGCALGAGVGKTFALLCGAVGPSVVVFTVLPPAAIFLWLEGAALSAIVTGVFDLNKVAVTQAPES